MVVSHSHTSRADTAHTRARARVGATSGTDHDALAALQVRHGHVHHPMEGHVRLRAEGILCRHTDVGRRLELPLAVPRLPLFFYFFYFKNLYLVIK
jgi:hypothetical protein